MDTSFKQILLVKETKNYMQEHHSLYSENKCVSQHKTKTKIIFLFLTKKKKKQPKKVTFLEENLRMAIAKPSISKEQFTDQFLRSEKTSP